SHGNLHRHLAVQAVVDGELHRFLKRVDIPVVRWSLDCDTARFRIDRECEDVVEYPACQSDAASLTKERTGVAEPNYRRVYRRYHVAHAAETIDAFLLVDVIEGKGKVHHEAVEQANLIAVEVIDLDGMKRHD